MSTTQLRLDTQALDATLIPSKISTSPTDDFLFPRDVTATRDLKLTDGNKLTLNSANTVYLDYNATEAELVVPAGGSAAWVINGIRTIQATESDLTGGLGTAPGDWALYLPQGTAAAPVIQIGNSPGFFEPVAHSLGISTDGVERARIDATALTVNTKIYNANGAAILPSYTFAVDNITGMYRIASNTIGFATGGLLAVSINPSLQLDLNSHKIINVLNPTLPQDAATKDYVDTAVSVENTWNRDSGNGYLFPATLTDKVGINTNTPAEQLDVNGNIATSGDVILVNDKKVIFDGSGDSFIMFDSANGVHRIQSAATYTELSSTGAFSIDANAGVGGGGDYDPNMTLGDDGSIQFQAQVTGTDAQRRFKLDIKKDITSGNHYQVELRRLPGDTPHLNFGYHADGAVVDGSIISGTNLTIESLSPLNLIADSVNISSRILNGDGTQATPAYGFFSTLTSPEAGMYWVPGTQTIMFAANGSNIGGFSDAIGGLEMQGNYQVLAVDGTQTLPGYAFSQSPGTGLSYQGGDVIAFSTGGTYRAYLDPTGFIPVVPIRAQDGTAGAPSYTFDSEPGTGIFWQGANQIGFSLGGSQVAAFSGTGDYSLLTGSLYIDKLGAAGDPTIGMGPAGSTGFFLPSANELAVALSSTEITRFTSAGIAMQGTSTIDMNGNKITSLGDPTTMQDAATKAYVDSVAAGLDPKASVRLGTLLDVPGYVTGTITIPNNNATYFPNVGDAAVIDGIEVVVGNRILVKNQTNPIENGIYEVVDAGVEGATDAVLERSSDMDGTPANEVSGGNFTFIEFGTQSGQGWTILWDGDIVLDTDPINWTQFSQQGSGTVNNGVAGRFAFYPVSGNSVDDTTTLTTNGTDRVSAIASDFSVDEGQKVILGNGDNTWIQSDSGDQVIVVQTNAANGADIVSQDYLDFAANTAGAYEPWFSLGSGANSGRVLIQNISEGTASTRALSLAFDQDITTNGFNSIVRLSRNSEGVSPYMELGYDSDGVGITGSRIRGTNLTVESLSPLNLVATSVDVSSIIKNQDGDSSNPSYTFSSDATTGFYKGGSGVDVAVSGGQVALFTTDGIFLPSGKSLTIGDSGDEIAQNGSDIIIRNNSSTIATFGATRLTSAVTIRTPSDGSASAPNIEVGHPTTGIYNVGSSTNLHFTVGSTTRLSHGGVQWESFSPFRFTAGVPGSAAISFTGDPDTGLFSPGANIIGFTADSTERARIDTLGIKLIDGTAANPSYSFTADQDTGLYRVGTDSLGFSAGAAQVAFFEPTRATYVQDVYIAQQTNSSGADLFITSRVGAAAAAVGGNFTMSAGDYPGSNNTGTATSGTFTITTRGVSNASLATATGGNIVLTSGSPLVNVSGGNAEARGGNITLSSGDVNQTFGSGTANKTRGGSITLTAGQCATSGDDLGGNITLTSFTPANGGSIIMNGTGAIGTPGAPVKGNIYANHVSLQLGSVASPAYTFTGDTDSGMYASAANNVAMTAGGQAITIFTSDDIGNGIGGLVMNGNMGIALGTGGQILADDGISAAPAYTFSSSLGTGFRYDGAGIVTDVNGNDVTSVTTGIFEVLPGNQLYIGAGSAGAPSLVVVDSTTGIFRPTSDQIGFTTAGTERVRIASSGILISVNGTESNPSIKWTSDANEGLWHTGADSFGMSAQGAEVARIASGALQMRNTAVIQLNAGTAGSPALQWTADPNTGLFNSADVVHISAGGSERARIDTTGIKVGNGSATAPSYSFVNDTDSGFALNPDNPSNQLDVVLGGQSSFTFARENASVHQLFSRFAGSNTRPVYSYYGESLTGMFFPSSSIGFTVGGTEVARISSSELDMLTNKIIQVADPTADTDAANKRYVDSVAAGLDPKASCRAATTAVLPAVTYNNGASGVGATLTANANGALPAQDGITLIVGNRLLVKNQAAALQNGIYTVTQVGDGSNPFILTRATDQDGSPLNEVSGGNFSFIEAGTVNDGTGWTIIWDGNIVIGTDPINWTQFSSSGDLVAGNGIDITFPTISVKHDGEGLIFSGSDLALELDGTSLSKSSAGLRVAAAGVTYAMSNVVTRETPSGTVDGVNDDFVLAFTPATGSEQVFLNGLLQDAAGEDYTIAGATITFTVAPLAGSKIRVTYWKA